MSQFPTIPAGKIITSGLLMSMLPEWVGKTTSTPRTSTATVAPDPELQAPVVASAEYTFWGYIRYSGGQTGDFKAQFTGPAGSTGSWAARVMNVSDIDQSDPSNATRVALNSPKSIGCISTTAAQTIQFTGRMYTAGTAGTFSFDWAQDTSNATATSVEADSFFFLRRVA